MPSFADHFSSASRDYAAFRPSYPAALFAWLAGEAPSLGRAWDCATGSGQAAVALASHFREVVATDASAAQVAQAARHERVAYAVMTAEDPALASGSVALVTVAQALHWFSRARFYAEVGRVLAPGGLVAAWRYGLASVSPEVDAAVLRFYSGTVGPGWPPERAIVEAGYHTIEFPFAEVAVPAFTMEARWTLAELGGYLSTWSAVTRYRAAEGRDPVGPLLEELAGPWGDPAQPRPVRWPLEVRAGRVR